MLECSFWINPAKRCKLTSHISYDDRLVICGIQVFQSLGVRVAVVCQADSFC